VVRGVAEEDTPIGTRGELMGSSGRKVPVAGTPEDGPMREWCRRGQRAVRGFKSP
jgi:hypothetical protein